jgi:3-phenylpropionate/trans-cinnamate dioxygenase ferredoxin reductase subunit
MSATFVIVGASLAGAKAAEELRARGFEGRVVLIGAEAERPYERPPLTKAYLRGESALEPLYVHPAGFYAEREIELLTGTTVTSVDAGAARVRFDDGRELGYDRLLLATGAEPRRLRIPGADLDAVHSLRTVSDCDRLRQRVEQGGRAVVVGAGWIGSEFAASARMRGLEVTLIDPLELPNERIFGTEVGSFYRDLHARQGVDLALGEGVAAFEGGGGAALRVRTDRGRTIECDFAVVGVGVLPRTGLARQAGLAVDDGILVDDQLRTSAPNVFAAGDVASAWHPLYERRIRTEHWANALEQGPAAARAMLGEPAGWDAIPFFFSDQYDVGMEYAGHAPAWDEVVLRGDPGSGAFVAFWLHGGRVAAGMNVNVWDVNEHIQALIRSGAAIDRRRLADPGEPLEALVDGIVAGAERGAT